MVRHSLCPQLAPSWEGPCLAFRAFPHSSQSYTLARSWSWGTGKVALGPVHLFLASLGILSWSLSRPISAFPEPRLGREPAQNKHLGLGRQGRSAANAHPPLMEHPDPQKQLPVPC